MSLQDVVTIYSTLNHPLHAGIGPVSDPDREPPGIRRIISLKIETFSRARLYRKKEAKAFRFHHVYYMWFIFSAALSSFASFLGYVNFLKDDQHRVGTFSKLFWWGSEVESVCVFKFRINHNTNQPFRFDYSGHTTKRKQWPTKWDLNS